MTKQQFVLQMSANTQNACNHTRIWSKAKKICACRTTSKCRHVLKFRCHETNNSFKRSLAIWNLYYNRTRIRYLHANEPLFWLWKCPLLANDDFELIGQFMCDWDPTANHSLWPLSFPFDIFSWSYIEMAQEVNQSANCITCGFLSDQRQSKTKHNTAKRIGTKEITYLALSIVNNKKSVVGSGESIGFLAQGGGREILCRLCGKSSCVDFISSDMIFIY